MTIDSKYLPRTYEISAGDTEYYFEHESIGGETVQPLIQYTEDDGYVWYLDDLGGTFTTTYGGDKPIYSRGKFDFLSGQEVDYGDLANAKLYIRRKTEITQLLDLIPYTPFPAEQFEFGLDKLTLILQEIDGEACSCPWGGTQDDPNEPVVGNPNPQPECQPYSCDAYLQYLLTSGRSYQLALTNAEDSSGLEFPFSEVPGDGKPVYYREYTAAPNQVTSWGGSPNSSLIAISTKLDPLYVTPDFCGAPVTYMVCVDHTKSYGDDAALLSNWASVWGDHQFEALICGHNGGSTILGGSLLRNTGKYWTITYGGSTSTKYDPDAVSVNLSNDGNDVNVFAQIRDCVDEGGNEFVLSNTVTSIDTANKMTLFAASITSGKPYPWLRPTDNLYHVVRDVSVNVSYGDVMFTITGRQIYGGWSLASNSGDFNATQAVVSSRNARYNSPRAFDDCKCSFGSISWNGGIDIDTVSQANIAFKRNFADYTPPGYC